VRRFEPEPPRRDPAAGERAPARPLAAGERAPEPLPAEAGVLGLQRAAGNRAVSALLARQPSPTAPDTKPVEMGRRAATSTLGLGDEIGVIPLESASLGQADRDGNVHDLSAVFVSNPAVPKIQEAMLKGKPIPEGFYSSTSMKLSLADIVITSVDVSDDAAEGEQIVSMAINFSSMKFEPVR
jgi:hypothetical protein